MHGDHRAQFTLPWQLVGAGGCLPKPYRSCQYGHTPFVEMAAVQVACPAADEWLAAHEENSFVMEVEEELFDLGVEKEPTPPPADPATMPVCHATVEWSWGTETITLPRDRYGPLGSSNVLFLAGFRPEFSEAVPAQMTTKVSRFPIQLAGTRGRAANGPREEYPVVDPGVILARRDAARHDARGCRPLLVAAGLAIASGAAAMARARRPKVF